MTVDWLLRCAVPPRAPWLAPWGDAIEALARLPQDERIAWLNARAASIGLRNANGRPIVFAPADDAGANAYEAHIHATGRVPTRAATGHSAHDLFNALVWLRWPRSKALLNAQQAAVLSREGVRPTRGRARDAATLIDENALVLACSDDASAAASAQRLAAHDWQALLLTDRQRWHRDWHPHAFGHALLDKLVRPYKAITAHAIVLTCSAPQDPAAVDAALAAQLGAAGLSPRLLRPLPVLGIPGWWPANDDPGFYADPAVFRPARTSTGRDPPN